MPLSTRSRAMGALLLAASLAACGGGEETGTSSAPAAAPPSLAPMRDSGTPQTEQSADDGLFARIPDIVAQVEPSVVTIFLQGGTGLGSGVVWRSDGLIITNEHVVRDAGPGGSVTVAFVDGDEVPGRVVATDAFTDVAVVDAQREGLPAARFQTALPRVGELAITLGSPLGFQNTAGAGIIAGLGREIPGSAAQGGNPLVDLIQTDAAISPGNSGGALVNGAGEVVGINEAYIPPQAGAVNLGFAIPAATAVDVAQQLVDTGRAERAVVGVDIRTITPPVAEQLDLPEGVAVVGVPPGTPAAQAGVQRGDVITELSGTPVRSLEEFLGELRQRRPGDVVELQINRDGQELTIPVTLGALPS